MTTLEGANMQDWIWAGNIMDKPAAYTGKGLHILVTDRDGKIVSRKMLLIDQPYSPSELERSIEVRLKELARDITVVECGYRTPVTN